MPVRTPGGNDIMLGNGIVIKALETNRLATYPSVVELLERPGIRLTVQDSRFTANLRELSPLEILAIEGEPAGLSTEDPEPG